MLKKILYGPIHNRADRYLLDKSREYLENGEEEKLLYLVPTPQLIQTFKQKLLEPAVINGAGSLHFYLFDGLYNELLKRAGRYREPINSLEEEIILRHIVQQLGESNRLHYFAGMIGFDGFYKGLVKLLEELEETGVDLQQWREQAQTAKEEELALIFSQYFDYLEQNQLQDSGMKRQQALDVIRGEETFLSSIELVIIDGFQRFTGNQYRFIRLIADLGLDILLNIKYDQERSELYGNVERIFKSLDFERQLFPAVRDEKPEGLSHLEENLFRLDAGKIEADSSVRLLESPEPSTELRQVARECKRLILKGVKPEGIGIITRNPGPYTGLIRNIFREAGLPYNFTRGIPVLETPVWKTVKDIFQIINSNLGRREVLGLLKSNLNNILTPAQYEEAEDLVIETGIIGGSDWYRLQREDANLAAGIFSAVRELEELRNRLSGKKPFFRLARAMWDYLIKIGLEEGILSQSELDWVARDLKSLQELEDRLDRLEKIIPFKLTRNEFLHWLEASLDGIEVNIRQGRGSKIEVLTPSQARGKEFKYLFLTGLLEGEFPLQLKRDWLFSPEEREELAGREIYFFNEKDQLIQERFFFYRSLSSAGKCVYLTYPSLGAEAGGKLISSFVQEVKKLFTEDSINRVRISSSLNFPSSLAEAVTVREARDYYLAHQDRDIMVKLLPVYRTESFRWSGKYSPWDGVLEDKLIRDEVGARYNQDYIYSVSELESYANCPFQFFANRVLRLKDIEEPLERLEALHFGNLYHGILYNFFQNYFPGNWKEDWEEYRELLKTAAGEVFEKFPEAVFLPEGMWQLYREEMVAKLSRLLYSEWQAKGPLPAYLELGFGLSKRLEEEENYNHPVPVSIETGGETIKFRGKIDRIDLSSDGRKAVIWDYKFGGRSQSYQKMIDGFNLQLPLYIMAAREILSQISETEVEVVGAGYYSINDNVKDGIWRARYEEWAPVTSQSKSCLTEEEWERDLADFREHFAGYLKKIRQADFRIDPEDCGYCDFKDICRYEGRRLGGSSG